VISWNINSASKVVPLHTDIFLSALFANNFFSLLLSSPEKSVIDKYEGCASYLKYHILPPAATKIGGSYHTA
jgi:hypothetical protein